MTEARLPLAWQAELILRIVIAAFCGVCIGLERERRFKDAGVRTHCMVACSAAVMVIISKYGFTDLVDATGNFFFGVRGADPARIAAQIVSGISFLGVGVIYRDHRNSTKGLTTAAGIWAVAGIGMAIGAGLYYIGLFTTVFVLVLQFVMHRSYIFRDRYAITQKLEVLMEDKPETLEKINEQLEQWKISIVESHITRTDDGLMRCRFVVLLTSEQSNQPVTSSLMRNAGIRSVDWGEPVA